MIKKFKLVISPSLVGVALLTTATLAQSQTTSPCAVSGTSANNLAVCSASFLGGSSDDDGSAVEIAPDKTVVFAGTIIGNNFGKIPLNLKAGNSTAYGGNGTIIRTDSSGKTILSVTRLGSAINDMDINRSNGRIAVVGSFGLAVLSSQGNQVAWSRNTNNGAGGGATISAGRRVAVGKNGEVAALFNKQVTVYDGNGNQLGQFTPSGTYVEDVAVDSTTGSVIVTGFSQKDGGGCSQLQVAFIRGYSYNGTLKWKDYDWSHSQAYSANSSCADTRGYRVAIGRDNMLYFAGESAGGNSIYRYNSRNLSANAPNVAFDKYNTAYQTRANQISYYARLNPSTGEIQKGQFALSRLSNNDGNTIKARAITADEKGNVYVSGISAAYIANRSNQTISSQRVGTYTGGDGFLLVIPPDFNSRKIWTGWTGSNSSGGFSSTIYGVSAANGVAAIMASQTGNMITVNPIQRNNPGGKNAFFSVFPSFTVNP